jgi:hypothetical protein
MELVAAIVEVVVLGAPGTKVTVAVWVSEIELVVSVADKVAVPARVDLTVKVTTPEAFEAPDAAEIVSDAPRLEAKVTVFPATGLLFESSRVTVTVEVDIPLAVTEDGEALTVELAALESAPV